MQLELEKAVAVFAKVQQVHNDIRAYCLAADRPALPIEELKTVVGKMYQLQISIEEVAYPMRYVRGMLLRYPSYAKIYVHKDQPEDWKRFTAAKELCHLINDENEDWSPKGADTLTGLLTELSFDNQEIAKKAEQSEMLAELAAVELLYPHAARKTDAVKLGAGQLTHARIANYHKMPEAMVLQSLAPDRVKLAAQVWAELDV